MRTEIRMSEFCKEEILHLHETTKADRAESWLSEPSEDRPYWAICTLSDAPHEYEVRVDGAEYSIKVEQGTGEGTCFFELSFNPTTSGSVYLKYKDLDGDLIVDFQETKRGVFFTDLTGNKALIDKYGKAIAYQDEARVVSMADIIRKRNMRRNNRM
jgi:hypothetical protein